MLGTYMVEYTGVPVYFLPAIVAAEFMKFRGF
jgi:hypothetical protein